tara:strand:- start:25039 stop:25899 length:861 start_codon:yes stop_codon:yes gene_type:complete
MGDTWENFISLNSHSEPAFVPLEPAAAHLEADSRRHWWDSVDYEAALEKDVFPLPSTGDREGYYGDHHFSYWASGLSDKNDLLAAARQHNVPVDSFLDFGCASGRVTRHFGIQHPEIRIFGCDINRMHVEWCNRYLPHEITTFQNHSIPVLPLPENSISMMSAYSVFTHIEAFETTWLMELKRILKPGGLAWITVHTDLTLNEMDETWPLYNAVNRHPKKAELLSPTNDFEGDRLVLRYRSEKSYTSNVFYKKEYLKRTWSRFFTILEFRHRFPRYQDVLLLQKPR